MGGRGSKHEAFAGCANGGAVTITPPPPLVWVMNKNSRTASESDSCEEELEWQERATNLALATVPFLPARVSNAFAEGRLKRGPPHDLNSADCISSLAPSVVSPSPVTVQACLLMVDISGFTALSEDARRRLGSEGVESFSLSLSAFFSVMIDTIARYEGDVDCFAGDAVLIVFVPRSAPVEDGNCQEGLQEAVRRALECAKKIHDRLDGFRQEADDPPLSMHSALASGDLTCVECGGEIAKRSEAFVLGPALSEIATALNEAKSSEIALAPSAVHFLGAHCRAEGEWRQALLASGHLLLSPTHREDDGDGSPSRNPPPPADGGQKPGRLSLGLSRYPCQSQSMEGARTRKVSRIVSRMREIENAQPSWDTSPAMSMSHAQSSWETPPARSMSHASLSWQSPIMRELLKRPRNTMGLEQLLRFVPEFVWSCLADLTALSTLTEHRWVTTMFVIADLKVHESKYKDGPWLSNLQDVLGHCIDVVETQIGGSTRQITVDDKGLAMIFVFGLPGYGNNQQCTPCIVAARKVLNLMAAAGIPGTAGIAIGTCFCGVVGDPRIRCEYAVMGDSVNTAARLAVAAAKQNDPILCSEKVASITKRSVSGLASHKLVLRPAGSIWLKGKREEAKVFRPEELVEQEGAGSAPVRVVGRDAEMDLLRKVVSDSQVAGHVSGLRLMVVEGELGMGKSTMMDQLMQEAREGRAELQGRDWMLVRGVEASSSAPFAACDAFLQSCHALRGDPLEHSVPMLLEASGPEDSLPSLMKRHAAAIAALRTEQQDKMAQLQALYAEIICDVLRDAPTVLILENIDRIDAQSLQVISVIATKLKLASQEAGKSGVEIRDQQPGSTILCTACESLLLSVVGEAVPACKLQGSAPCAVTALKLEPLRDEAVLEISEACLGCRPAQPVAAFLVECSSGVPLQAVELCAWLQAENFLVDGQVQEMDARADLTHLMPPSIQAIIQAKVDRLPPAPGVVLRYACVWAGHFHTGFLLEMLPKDLVCDLKELEEVLLVLVNANLIRQISGLKCSHTLGGDAGTAWKFCNSLQQDVVYSLLPHRYRRVLHRRAAVMIERQLEKPMSLLERRTFLKAMTQHMLLAAHVGTRDIADGFSLKQMNVAQVVPLADALGQAAEVSLAVGDYEEMYSYRTQQLAMLKEQNNLAENMALALLTFESAAVRDMMTCVAAINEHDPATTLKVLGDPVQRLAELSSRQDALQAAVSQYT